MISRLVRVQFAVFVVVTVVGVVAASILYVKLPQLIGVGRYEVHLEIPSSGGLYTQAAVTVRGVEVGQVKDVHLTDTGVEATLQVDDGTKIPVGSRVEIRNTSAVGEQYVDFEPTSDAGPYLAHGAVVRDDVHLPPQVSSVLSDTNALLASIPPDALKTTIDELYTGFRGNETNLRRIVDATDLLVHTGVENLPATTGLVDDAQQVLATQIASLPALERYVPNLATFTQTLNASDADIRGTIAAAGGFGDQLTVTFQSLQPILPTLLARTNAVGQVVQVYLPNVRDLLTVLPATNNEVRADVAQSPTIAGKQVAGLNFKAPGTLVNDQYCTQGFPYATQQRTPEELSLTAIPTSAYCGANGSTPAANQDARGARNGQCPNDPNRRGATAVQCGLVFDPNKEVDGTPFSLGTDGSTGYTAGTAVTASSAAASGQTTDVTVYDPLTGLLDVPGGGQVILGGVAPGDRMTSWQSLFLGPLGTGS